MRALASAQFAARKIFARMKIAFLAFLKNFLCAHEKTFFLPAKIVFGKKSKKQLAQGRAAPPAAILPVPARRPRGAAGGAHGVSARPWGRRDRRVSRAAGAAGHHAGALGRGRAGGGERLRLGSAREHSQDRRRVAGSIQHAFPHVAAPLTTAAPRSAPHDRSSGSALPPSAATLAH